MAIGKRIEARLKELSLERKDLLARVPGLSAQALSKLILRDSKRSELDVQIAEALDMSVLELVYGARPVVSEPQPKPYRVEPANDAERLLLAAFRRASEDARSAMLAWARSILPNWHNSTSTHP
jgi:hypothetical protein